VIGELTKEDIKTCRALKVNGTRRETALILALHSAPRDLFKTKPPYGIQELKKLVRKASLWGFKGFQVGPLWKLQSINSKQLKSFLDKFEMERTVHVGGLYDATKLSKKDGEYDKISKELDHGILLCQKISSDLMSFHPPFFTEPYQDEEIVRKTRSMFLDLVSKALDFASKLGIRLALESFCYHPFIFHELNDFMAFISHFPSSKLGILMDVGHLYQAKIDLKEAVNMFKSRLFDVHIHDATRKNNYHKATHLPLGKGTINFDRLMDDLQQIKYRGWLTLKIKGTIKEIVQSKNMLENLLN
jgi:sugar phosphate isomerase/epimerase